MTRSSNGEMPAGLQLYSFRYPAGTPVTRTLSELDSEYQLPPEEVFLSCRDRAIQVATQFGAISFTHVLSGHTTKVQYR